MKSTSKVRHVFGLVIPDMGKGSWSYVATGIRLLAQKDGHGVCVPLCWDDPAAVLRHPSVFARLCTEFGIDGVFLRALPERKDTRRVLSALRREKIPAVLLRINGDESLGVKGVDVVTLRAEGRVPLRLAVRLGRIASHALLQRLANPRNPPADLVLE